MIGNQKFRRSNTQVEWMRGKNGLRWTVEENDWFNWYPSGKTKREAGINDRDFKTGDWSNQQS